ncbi:MAG: aminotransferase class I/II-fold pyridoxal phosphate-dependent enzyme [Myxococcales bacterium]
MAKAKSFYSRGRKVQTVDRIVSELQREGILKQRAASCMLDEWVVEGRSMRNFGSCSYMGLERHPMLIDGAMEALLEFGANFSISRIYLECPLYASLEERLEQAVGRPVLVTPSTTMAHLAALPVLIGDDDLVIVDQFAHASIHMTTDLVADVPVELVRHSRMDLLEQRLAEAGDRFERIWYLCDGLYSMLGDFAPFAALRELLQRYPRLHLYVDDAHAMSWIGRHGRGAALSELDGDRVVVAMSLSKAFGAGGGLLALPTVAIRERIRNTGGTLVFSGPLSPAVLGACVGSARLHLLPEFDAMQRALTERIACTRNALDRHQLKTATADDTPIFMVHYDSAPRAAAVVRGLRERGFYTCVSAFPAVPMNKPSIRFTVNRHNSFEDIERLVQQLSGLSRDVGGVRSSELQAESSGA